MNIKRIRRTTILCVLCVAGAAAVLAQQPSTTIQNASPSTPSIFIRIQPDRMEPQQVTITHGQIMILVQNHSTAPNVTISLDQTGGSNVSSAALPPGQHHSLQSYYLAPGTYVLSETHHPAWKCTITVN